MQETPVGLFINRREIGRLSKAIYITTVTMNIKIHQE